jgi:dTDP-4-dehydrorhamnose 3,5-epimerase
MIDGVVVKQLVTHSDQRGFFREIIRVTDDFFAPGFGQLSHSLVHPGVVKAWHAHHYQTQWTYVALGDLEVVLHDTRPASPTFRRSMELLVGENHSACAYSMPPGVAHGLRCVSGPAHVIYVTSGTYDPDDEVRIAPDNPDMGFNWTARPPVK